MRTPQGLRLVLVSDETRVERHDGQEASLGDLPRHVPVAVFGQFGDDDRTLMARVIVLLPPRT